MSTATDTDNFFIIHVTSQHPNGPNYVSTKLFRTQSDAENHVKQTEIPYLESYHIGKSYECSTMDSQFNDGICVQYEFDQEVDIVIQIILGVVN